MGWMLETSAARQGVGRRDGGASEVGDAGRTKEEMRGGPMERQPGLKGGLWERGESRP